MPIMNVFHIMLLINDLLLYTPDPFEYETYLNVMPGRC